MTIAVTNIGTATSVGGVATVTLAIPSSVPAGALICVAVWENLTVGTGTVGDTVNTYSLASSVSNRGTAQLFYVANAGALTSSNTITYTKASSTREASISAFYATGVLASSPLDSAVTATSNGVSGSPSFASGTPAVSGELFVAVGGVDATGYTQDTTHNWASPPNASAGAVSSANGGNQVNAGTSAITYAPTFGSNAGWGAIIVGFKPAAGGTRSFGRVFG